MDIRKFSVEETTVVHLRDASDALMYADDEQTLPVRVELYGPGSKPYAKAQATQNTRMLDRLKRKGKVEQSADEMAEERVAFLVACTKGFENIEYDQLQGEALYKAVYGDRTLGFIPDQLNKHLGDWGNFTKDVPQN